ncbi:hypothetical protein BM221_005969 [Beauveria bassiana]|uniref:Uncharacterized protein n=1 Tax=Beauveria bassiana TaxID=176275 RepID=A0A2N6NKI6_BEABA|nr:hypothetical protein BM221_005969 [Beauveria bassiana]
MRQHGPGVSGHPPTGIGSLPPATCDMFTRANPTGSFDYQQALQSKIAVPRFTMKPVERETSPAEDASAGRGYVWWGF